MPEWWISLAILVLTPAGSVLASWVTQQVRLQGIEDAVRHMEERHEKCIAALKEDLQTHRDRLNDHTKRIAVVEQAKVRSDERWNFIDRELREVRSGLNEISGRVAGFDQKLDRILGRLSGMEGGNA